MITIFTPTYNRKLLIERVYESLKKQTNTDFIWLVVDDGSTDGTSAFFDSIKSQSSFTIKYYYQKNGGKHRAHNTAIKNCTTDYFLILDSDDWLVEDAIEKLYKYSKKIEDNTNCAGIIGNRYYAEDGEVVGTKVMQIEYASGNELYQKYGLKGDTIRMYKTECLRRWLFPEIENEKFVPENVVFDKIDINYKLLVIHDKLYMCEYQPNGYSNSILKVHLNNPKGYAESLKSSAESAVTIYKRLGYIVLYMIWITKNDLENELTGIERIASKILFPIHFILNKLKLPHFFYEHFNN